MGYAIFSYFYNTSYLQLPLWHHSDKRHHCAIFSINGCLDLLPSSARYAVTMQLFHDP